MKMKMMNGLGCRALVLGDGAEVSSDSDVENGGLNVEEEKKANGIDASSTW